MIPLHEVGRHYSQRPHSPEKASVLSGAPDHQWLVKCGHSSAPGPDRENLHWVQESAGLRSQSADSESGF